MPGQALYIAGYNLNKQLAFGGYQLTDINIGHHQLVRYKEYEYPTSLVWKVNNINHNKSLLESGFRNHVAGTKMIFSEYGNPYLCNFGDLTFTEQPDGSIIAASVGNCKRMPK